ncbi:MAG: hypothetical protein ACLQUY_15525 [Ktedonobacterales bacterium]
MPRSSRRDALHPSSSSAPEIEGVSAVGTFLRNLADRADANAALAREIGLALAESGLLAASDRPRRSRMSQRKPGAAKDVAPLALTEVSNTPTAPLDPFRVLHDQGKEGLGEILGSMELAELRAIVRRHRLDPARISARWRDRERVIQLIMSQVQAYENYGKAFAHV